MTGSFPRRFATMSRTARTPIFAAVRVGIAKEEDRPEVNGHCATAAAMLGSSAAVAMACPPPKEVPHTMTRSGSAPSMVRAWVTAAFQSSR